MKNKNKTRIDLLPAADKERYVKNKKRAVVFFVIIACVLFIFLLDFTLYYKNNRKKTYILSLNQKLTIMKTQNILGKSLESAINSKRKLKNMIQKRILVIKNLEKLKVEWNKKIAKMVNASPKGIWMSGLLLQNGIIAIKGNSISLTGISAYMNSLKKTGMFKKIILTDASRNIIDKNTFYQFQLKAVLK